MTPRPAQSLASRGAVLLTVLLAACAPLLGTRGAAPAAPPAPPSVAVAPTEPATYVVIRLRERRLQLMEPDRETPIASFPIAVGRPGHETPTGHFQVEELVEHPEFLKVDPNDRTRVLKRIPPGHPTNPLGERWIGFAHGDGWTVGIHGTPNPELLGRAVSGGCIRMRNADVLEVWNRVRLGTPVVVHP